jgi:hypothetical protein
MNIQKQNTDNSNQYQELLERISRRYVQGQAQAVRSVNESITQTNWEIGQYIVEYEQGENRKAKYGTKLLENLARDLRLLHGRGFRNTQCTIFPRNFLCRNINYICPKRKN